MEQQLYLFAIAFALLCQVKKVGCGIGKADAARVSRQINQSISFFRSPFNNFVRAKSREGKKKKIMFVCAFSFLFFRSDRQNREIVQIRGPSFLLLCRFKVPSIKGVTSSTFFPAKKEFETQHQRAIRQKSSAPSLGVKGASTTKKMKM